MVIGLVCFLYFPNHTVWFALRHGMQKLNQTKNRTATSLETIVAISVVVVVVGYLLSKFSWLETSIMNVVLLFFLLISLVGTWKKVMYSVFTFKLNDLLLKLNDYF